MICLSCHQKIEFPFIQWTGKNISDVQAFIAPAVLAPTIGRTRLEYNGLLALDVDGVRHAVFTGDRILKTPDGLQIMSPTRCEVTV